MLKRLLPILAAVVVLLGLLPIAANADDVSEPSSIRTGLPVDPNYDAIKAAIDARAPGQASAAAAPVGLAPTTLVSWKGLGPSSDVSPSDATGAISPDRYIELVNQQIGIFGRTGTRLSLKTEGDWTGFGSAAVGDGQILWDTHDLRFYYAMIYFANGSNELGYGFSKTASPSAKTADWCNYHSTFGSYGSDFADYPKLGQTADFLLIGVNRYASDKTTYKGSDVAWVTKPLTGVITTCPPESSFRRGVKVGLQNADGTKANTPVPGRKTDFDTTSDTGYVVASKDPGSGTSSILSVFTVTKSVYGYPVFSSPSTINVTSYAYPPSVPQKDTSYKLATLDARLTNAWVAPDPTLENDLALWTQHTVAASTGGLGSEVRWYEIDLYSGLNGVTPRSGIAQSPSLYVFDGAIASDRNGATGQFGNGMVLGFNTSSATQPPALQMVSKVGEGVQSGFVLIATSRMPDVGYDCPTSLICRWGDYGGASPDPAPPATGATQGNVWLSGMLANGGDSTTPGWTTQNWEAQP